MQQGTSVVSGSGFKKRPTCNTINPQASVQDDTSVPCAIALTLNSDNNLKPRNYGSGPSKPEIRCEGNTKRKLIRSKPNGNYF